MKFSNSKIFLFSCTTFIIGVALGSFMPKVVLCFDLLWFSLSLFSLICSIIFWKNFKLRLIFFFSLFLLIGIWRYSLCLLVSSQDKIYFYNNQKIQFGALVSDEVIQKTNKQKITLSHIKINKLPISGKVLMVTEVYPRYNYGDILDVECELQAPEKIENFAYDRYLARYGVYSVCYYPKIRKIVGEEGNYFLEKILYLKSIIRQTVIAGSREPYAGLIQATLLGGNDSIDPTLQKLFSRVGISHLIAISGMHISLLALILLWFFITIGFNRHQAFYLILSGIWLYVGMIGFMPSAARAALMSSLFLWAIYLGRLSKSANVLALAALILLIFNPLLLRDDLGFQLSFLAMLGMGLFYLPLEAWAELKKIPEAWGMRQAFFLSLSAQVFTVPVIAYNFSQISLVEPLANLLVLWTAPFLLVLPVVAIILSLVFPSLALFWFLPSEFLFAYIIKISEFLSNLPGSYLNF